MGYEILKGSVPGCDFVLNLTGEKKRIKLLQLTDMQIIDSAQCRFPDRLRSDEIAAWLPENAEGMCLNHIRSLVAQTNPDLIFITGDIIYGQFDDSGKTFRMFCEFMEGFGIPWAPVFGNHDNESKIGVDWQCEMFENSPTCIFERGAVTGNGNYTIGISVNGALKKVMYMLDTHGCVNPKGIYPDQMEMVREKAELIEASQGRKIPAFTAMHIPTAEFQISAEKKGYARNGGYTYCIGADVKAQDGDFGCRDEKIQPEIDCPGFLDLMKRINCEAVFAGHYHNINTCVLYEGIRWIFGLKTGQYDYHIPGQLGGTLVTLEGDGFDVSHVPALVRLAPYPEKAPMFEGFFVNGEIH